VHGVAESDPILLAKPVKGRGWVSHVDRDPYFVAVAGFVAELYGFWKINRPCAVWWKPTARAYARSIASREDPDMAGVEADRALHRRVLRETAPCRLSGELVFASLSQVANVGSPHRCGNIRSRLLPSCPAASLRI
jgi:hypothetical protein